MEVFSCKSSQKTNEVKNQEQKKGSVSQSSTVIVSDSNNYRFTVSFYSKGGGTDYKMKEKYLNFIKEFQQKKSLVLIYEITTWGKEGETDYCFKLLELTSPEQDQFVKGSKELLKESGLVIIEENTTCRHKK